MASSFPALGITTPKFDSPLTTLGQLANLRSQQTENMLRQQQISASQQQQDLIAQETAQKQREVRDQNTTQSMVKDPANAAAFGAGNLGFLTGYVSPEYQNKLQEGVSKAHKEKSLASVEDLKLDAQHLQDATESLFGINQVYAKDPVAGAAAYTSARQLLIDKGNRYAMKAPAEIHSADELQAAEAGLNMTAGINSKALALKEAQAKNDLTAAQSADAAANARAAGVKADRDQFELDLEKGAADGSQDAVIDKQFAGNPEGAQAAKNAWAANIRQKDGLKLAHEAVGKIYDQYIGDAVKAKSLIPGEVSKQAALLPGEVKKAGAVASAEIAPRIAAAVGTQQALAKLSPDAFAQIPNVVTQREAMNETDKIFKEYTDKSTVNQAFLDTIKEAQKNPVAAATIPMQTIKEFFNRANQSELKSVSSGVGSVFQRADTWFEKNSTGTPPQWLLDDTAKLGKIQQMAARRNFEAGKDRLKMRGVDVSKLPEPSGISGVGSGGGNSDMVSAQIPGQPAGQIHRSQRAQFLKDHPGATAGQ